jgi:predicted DNA binding CopG/RHH family protein
MSNKGKTLKRLPVLLTDSDAEQFTDEADLTEYDLSGFVPAGFEFQPKKARLELRLPQEQLDAVKREAKARGIPYTRLVRQFIEQGMRSI